MPHCTALPHCTLPRRRNLSRHELIRHRSIPGPRVAPPVPGEGLTARRAPSPGGTAGPLPPGPVSRRNSVFLLLAAFFLTALVLVAGAPPAAAAPPSGPYADWAEGPVGYLLTEKEEDRWEAIRTDAEAQRFIDLFWSKRDPDLETPVNEFKQEIDRRIAIADANFGGEAQRGSLTDRGKVFILLGEPRASQQRIGSDQVRQPGELATRSGDEARVFWEYDTAELPVRVPAARLLVGFYELVRGRGEFVLDRSAPGASLALRALRRAPEAYVVHPRLERPVHPVGATPPPEGAPSAGAAAPPSTGQAPPREPAQKGAVPDPVLAGWFLVDPAPWPEDARLVVVAGAGEAAAGEDTDRPVWLQLELPPEAPRVERLAVQWRPSGMAAESRWSLAEIPVEGFPLNSGVAYQGSLPLPPGDYDLVVAGGSGPRPTAVRPATVSLEPVPGDRTWLSEIYAAPHVQQRPDQPLGSPFLVAGWHLVPDPVVLRGQELSYFGYVSTPPGGEAPPQIEATVSLSHEGRSLGAPFTETLQPSPVREGLWMYGSAITVGGLPEDGEYVLTFRVEDASSGQHRSLRVPFRLAAPRQPQ